MTVPLSIAKEPIVERGYQNWGVESVDINPTAKCNLSCGFCWGPDHKIDDQMDTSSWKRVLDFVVDRGTTGVVFTGGEPLIRKDILDLVGYAKEKKLRVTLSTNTLLLQKRSEVLQYIDEIGIPLDGSTAELNSKMRLGTGRHFDSVIAALPLIRRSNPNIEVTVRTVVSNVNKDDILSIGEVLDEQKALWDRWKIYQFARVANGSAQVNPDDHQIDDQQFDKIGSLVKEKFPDLNTRIYASRERTGRYVFFGPEGNIYGVGDDGDYKYVANFIKSDHAEMERSIINLINPAMNALHANPSKDK